MLWADAAKTQVSSWTTIDLENRFELSLFLSQDAEYEMGYLKAFENHPPRIFVDLDSSSLASNLEPQTLTKNPWVDSVRVAQNSPDKVRVVFELDSESKQSDFVVEKNEKGIRVFRKTDSSSDLPIAKTTSKEPQKLSPKPVASDVVLLPAPKANSRKKSYTIIIDPGHGGKHPGAIGPRGTMEKHVVLGIAKRVRDLLKKTTSHHILMTREKDVYVDLLDRTKFANNMSGDLFVSIHANSSPRSAAKGVSTYFLNNADDEESLRVATRENGELDPKLLVQSSGKKDDYYLEIMKASMMKNFHTTQSTDLARSVQSSMVGALKAKYKDIYNRGVKSAGLYVLTGAQMPAILVETSFISNPTEESRLKDSTYQHFLAMAIRNGVVEFLDQYQPSGEKHASLY
ncbi:MAG: N-acetylmuramoyl-L-alanine amidase [Bdellovibrionales bacterium]|nr:N-acetylmuramoyl-L-alanine amidase [Bdellovibrionales bacterium]